MRSLNTTGTDRPARSLTTWRISLKNGNNAVIVSLALSGGGAQDVAREWAKGLRESQFTVTMVAFDSVPDEITRSLWEAHGIQVRPISATGHLSRVKALRQILSEIQPSAVISLETYPNLATALAARGMNVKLVFSEHNIPSILLRVEGIAKRLQLQLAKVLYRRADWIIGVSHAVTADLRCNFHLDPRRVVTLLNPVLSEVSPATRELDFNGGRRVTLVVPARLVPQKRPHIAAEIAACLRGRGVDADVLWVGDPRPGKRDLLDQAADSKFYQVPWDPKWTLLCEPHSIVLLPSAYEGLGNVLIAAAHEGIPVVAGSSALGCADAILPGISGELASHDSPSAYADAVARIIESSSYGGPIPSPWLDRFQVSRCTEALVDLIGCDTVEQKAAQ